VCQTPRPAPKTRRGPNLNIKATPPTRALRPEKEMTMVIDFRLWLACLFALLATSYAPHPATWGIVGLFVVSDPRLWARIGRIVTVKMRETEIVISPPEDRKGIPLVPMPGEIDEMASEES
jgi:hypothetical protein